MTDHSYLSGLLHRMVSPLLRLWRIIVEYVLRLRIRTKLSLIIAITVILVASILSSIIISQARRGIRSNVESLARLTTEHLANASRDHLLLQADVPVKETVDGIVRMNIEGVERIMIVDRNGVIVAHSNLALAAQQLSGEEKARIEATSELTSHETPEQLEYIRPIYVHHVTKTGTRTARVGTAVVTFSKEILYRPLGIIERTILLAAFVVCAVAIMIVSILSGSILQVILELSDGARRVGEGDYHVRIFTRIKDEIGALTREFNKMVEQIRERAMLQKFVSTHAMTMIQQHQNVTLGGERKSIAVVFTDIRNFTRLTDTMPPEEVVSLINTYLDAQMNVITAWNGSVDKFMGDGVMAIFTGPSMMTDAVQSAIAIQQCLREINPLRASKGEITVEIGIGINAGPTIMGNIGSRTRMDFTAIGDAVNIASRLCDLAEPNQILISETIMEGLDKSFKLKNEGSVRFKGKRSSIAIYSVQSKGTA